MGGPQRRKKKKRLATAIVETTHYARSPKWIIVKLWSTNRIQESKDAKETHHKFNIQDNSNWLQTTNCTWIFLVQFNIWLCSCPAHHEKLMIGQSSECWQRVHFLKLRSEINALGLFWVAHWLLVVCQYQSDSVWSSRRGGGGGKKIRFTGATTDLGWRGSSGRSLPQWGTSVGN